MDFPGQLKPELWVSIAHHYEDGNYREAVLAAIQYITTTLRERAGLDGDGAKLVGQALGGTSPRLRVTELVTETDKDVQAGVEDLLRGMYRAIRNPRIHGTVTDGRASADAIIAFVNYLLNILDQSRGFDVEAYLQTVFEPLYVSDGEYWAVLAAEIPPGRRADVLIKIWQRRFERSGQQLHQVIEPVLSRASDDQVQAFAQVVSSDLRRESREIEIARVLQMLEPGFWPRLDEAARRRAEEIVYQSLRKGDRSKKDQSGSMHGWLATWARDYLPIFTTRTRFSEPLVEKLRVVKWKDDARDAWQDEGEACYVIRAFLLQLPLLITETYQIEACIEGICHAVKAQYTGVTREIQGLLHYLPDSWQHKIATGLANAARKEDEVEYTFLEDGTPISWPTSAEVSNSPPF